MWVPITLDLTSGTAPGFDPSQVVQIAVQLLSGFPGGLPVVAGGPTVFEIDGVTD